MCRRPVFVEVNLPLWIDEVPDELLKSHVCPKLKSFRRGVTSVVHYDLGAESRGEVVGDTPDLLEFVPEGRDQAAEGFPDQHELEVVVQAVLDLLRAEVSQVRLEARVFMMNVVRLDVQRVGGVEVSRQYQEDPTPGGGGYFRYRTVQHLGGRR